jgi:hypothetical protein
MVEFNIGDETILSARMNEGQRRNAGGGIVAQVRDGHGAPQ